MKEWLKTHWKELLIAVLTAVVAVLSACGSTWRISDNKVGVIVMKNDTLKCKHDSIPWKEK